MRRVRLATGPGALFLAMFVAALLVFLPLRLALGWFGLAQQGMTARAVTGSVWAGSLREARFGQIALGDLSAGLSPVQLLVGRARVGLKGLGAAPLSGAIGVTRYSFGLDDVTAALPVGNAFRPVPVTLLDLQDVSVRFRGDACEKAEGRVRATLAGEIGGLAVPAALTGAARCDGGALLLPLTSAAGGEGSTIRLWPDGRFRAELTLQPGDAAANARLQAMGFVATGAGMQLAIEGRF